MYNDKFSLLKGARYRTMSFNKKKKTKIIETEQKMKCMNRKPIEDTEEDITSCPRGSCVGKETDEEPDRCGIDDFALSEPFHLESLIWTNVIERALKGALSEASFSHSNLKGHINTHRGEIPNEFSHCKSSPSKPDYIEARRKTREGKTHVEKPYKCSICEASFSLVSSLKRHGRVHTGEKPYKCTLCESSFTQSGYLNIHIRIHTGEKPHKCTFCEASFSDSSSLRQHTRIHTGEKPYKCTFCSAAFAVSSGLKYHVWTHTGEKPHKCTFCEASFSHATGLRVHTVLHTGVKPYKCSQCEASFTQSGHLTRHMKIHTFEKLHRCSICCASFSQFCQLKVHIKTQHKHNERDYYDGPARIYDLDISESSSPRTVKPLVISCGPTVN